MGLPENRQTKGQNIVMLVKMLRAARMAGKLERTATTTARGRV